MKGKTKIELFENGIQVKEQEDHNLVTAFLETLINMNYMPITNQPVTTYVYPMTDYADISAIFTYLNGLILFADPLTLDAAHYRLPTNNDVVGFASAEKVIANPKHGNLNLAESVYDGVAKTQKLVFDFPTDRGNGTFESLGLAPARGARSLDLNSGYCNVGGVSMDFDDASIVYYDTVQSFGGIPIGLINGILYHVNLVSSLEGVVPIFRHNTPFLDYTPLNIFHHKKYVVANEVLSDLEYTVPAGRRADFKILNNKFYSIEHNTSSPFDIDIKELNPADMSVISTLCNITDIPGDMDTTWYFNYSHIAGDVFYTSEAADKTVLHMYNITTGNKIGTLTPPSPYTSFDEIFQVEEDGSLLLIGTNIAYHYMLLDENGLSAPFLVYPRCYSSRNTAIPIGPTINFFYSGGAMNMSLISLGLITQNNLVAPVTKTSAQTMKITYTLSW